MLRSLRIRRYLLQIENEVLQQLGEMILILIVMVFFDACLMQFLESHLDRPLTLNDWLYYTFVTLTTVGYGDIAPWSLFGRFAAMSYIFMAVTVVPSLTNSLLTKMNATSVYARTNYVPMNNTNHVVICGDLSSTLLLEFFGELFHEGIVV
jgi:voltage-gated potassium channel